jgi:hypothetical protein
MDRNAFVDVLFLGSSGRRDFDLHADTHEFAGEGGGIHLCAADGVGVIVERHLERFHWVLLE